MYKHWCGLVMFILFLSRSSAKPNPPSMSAASGEASVKMAEFQSGQYKLWPCQLMAELNSTHGEQREICVLEWIVNCLKPELDLTVGTCRSRWVLPRCSTTLLARERPPLPLPSVSGQLALREDLTALPTISGSRTTRASCGRTSEWSMKPVKRRRDGHYNVQGGFFNCSYPKISKCQPVSKFWHLELFLMGFTM